jgi:hypothetical protein
VTTWILVVALFVVVAVYTSWTAGRLDRLHARVDAAWAGLDAALVRRAAAARALVTLLPSGPEASRLERTALASLEAGPVDREAIENNLSAALRAALPLLPEQDGRAELLRAELDEAVARVGFARSFHNSAVAGARALRRHRYPRALRLAGHRAMPRHFDTTRPSSAKRPPDPRR